MNPSPIGPDSDAAPDPARPLVGVTVGNTRTRVGLLVAREVEDAASYDSPEAAAQAVTAFASRGATAAIVASVNTPAADALERALRERSGLEVFRFGRDLRIPIRHALDDASTVGHDRLLCAIGAYSRAQQACVVIDAGTAITVNFVDGEGTFQGGVIAPGLSMMLRALHEQTHALPLLDTTPPDPARGPFGKDTDHAIRLGVRNAALGLVRHTVERFAEAYDAYPQIIATGGDAAVLFAGDELVEHVVPDLQLLGLAEACRRLVNDDDED